MVLVRVINRLGPKTFLVRAATPPPRDATIVDRQWMPIRLTELERQFMRDMASNMSELKVRIAKVEGKNEETLALTWKLMKRVMPRRNRLDAKSQERKIQAH